MDAVRAEREACELESDSLAGYLIGKRAVSKRKNRKSSCT